MSSKRVQENGGALHSKRVNLYNSKVTVVLGE